MSFFVLLYVVLPTVISFFVQTLVFWWNKRSNIVNRPLWFQKYCRFLSYCRSSNSKTTVIWLFVNISVKSHLLQSYCKKFTIKKPNYCRKTLFLKSEGSTYCIGALVKINLSLKITVVRTTSDSYTLVMCYLFWIDPDHTCAWGSLGGLDLGQNPKYQIFGFKTV